MIKNLILSFLLMVTAVNAYESDLIRPKAGQPTIIDIGITDPSIHNTVIPKDWMLIDAQFREIDKDRATVARELGEKWDCLTDGLEHQNCSEQAETCPGSNIYSSGGSTRYDKLLVIPPYLESDVYVCKDTYIPRTHIEMKTVCVPATITKNWWWCDTCSSNSADIAARKDSVVQVVIVAGGTGLTETTETIEDPSVGTMNVKAYQHNAQNSIYFQLNSGFKLEVKPNEKFYFHYSKGVVNIATDVMISASDKPTLYISASGELCTEEPETIIDDCRKDYHYYIYDCDNLAYPADYLYTAAYAWKGPLVDTGGDCLGLCGADGCACNSSSGPSTNCSLENYVCSFDVEKPCTRVTTEEGELILADEDYIYSNGTSVEFTDRLVEDRSCVEGMTWNIDELRCEDIALKECLKPGYTIDFALNECFGPASCAETEVYDITQLKCVERVSDDKKCAENFLFDYNENRCVLDPICERGKLDQATGECVTLIDRCFSGLYNEDGNCKFLVNGTDIFGKIQLLANIGSFDGGDVPVYSYLTSSENQVVLSPDSGEYITSSDSPTGFEIKFLDTAPENYDLGTIFPAGSAIGGDQITFNFWMKWDGVSSGMPIAFNFYDLWMRPTETGTMGLGFNTGQGDMVGIMDMSPYANKWIEITVVFTHLNPEENYIYINGVKINKKYNVYDDTDLVYRTFNSLEDILAYESSTGNSLKEPMNSRAVIEGAIHFNGWEINSNYALGYSIAGLKVYNQAKTYSEIHTSTDGGNLMTLHSEEQLSSINTSYLRTRGFGEGNKIIMESFHYGSGCGYVKFNPAPDSYEVINSEGGSVFGQDYCTQNNALIGSGDKKYGTVVAVWNNPPERIDYLCDDFCFISPRTENIDPVAITIPSEVCPTNKDEVYWRFDEDKGSCVADMIVEPFICEGSDWVYDTASNTCAALMNNWHIAEGASSGIWYISEDKRKMYQAQNSGVILNISDKIYTDEVIFKGDFLIMDGGSTLFEQYSSWATEDGSSSGWKDDDFIGFVFGYDEFTKDGYLLSINKSLLDPNQVGVGHSFDGYGSTKISGVSLREGNPLIFGWGLGTTSELSVLDSNLGSKVELEANSNIYRGWNREERTNIKVEYTKTSIKVWIKGTLVINHPLQAGEFKAGKIGFLNYSQGGVLYDGFQVLTNELCAPGLIFSEVLNKCFKPVDTLYANTVTRTYADIIGDVLYESNAICPVDGTLEGRSCQYNISCDDGIYNNTTYFCEDPLNTDICIAPKEIAFTDKYKDKSLEGTINLKGFGEISYHYPDLRNKKTGISISSTLLKLSDGLWYKFEGTPTNPDLGWRDTEIVNSGLNVKTLSTNEYTINAFSTGDCYNYVGNGFDNSSNECIGDMDIIIPNGLTLVAISDVQSVTNESTENNFFNEKFTIDNKFSFYRKGFGDLEPINILNPELVCSSLPICPDDEELSYDADSNPVCKSNVVSYYCNDGQSLVPDTDICQNDGFCEEGFINLEENGTCIRDYTFYKYSCPTDFEIAEEGLDCEGSCGFDDCFCNTETPPANNCKKSFNSGDSVSQTSVRTIRTHTVTGELLEEEYGNYKNYNCGENCKFNIIKIVGEANKLCFEKKNGDSECFEVDGCSFKGTVTDLYSNAEVPKLRDLNLVDTHTLTISDYNSPADIQTEGIACPSSGMTYSDETRYCEGSANFYDWEKKGSADGDWVVTNSGSKVFQGFNTTSPAFYVSKLTYPQNVVFSGSMTTGNDGDDDWVGLVFGYTGVNDYYVVRLSRDPSDPITHNATHTADLKLSLIKVTGGVSTYLDRKDHPGWRANVPLDIKVAYIDKKIIVFINGTEWMNYDSGINLVGGRIGFYNLSQSTVTYENFHISSSPTCDTGYIWEDASRSCVSTADQELFPDNKIESTCKMNGHVGWHSREEGIVSIISDGDRLKFWDPYKDKDLGFIEFVKDTNEQDNIDGFRPENQDLYNLLSDGFTSIDAIDAYIYYVSGGFISDNECTFFANKYNLLNIKPDIYNEKLKQMSGDRYKEMLMDQKCNQGIYVESISSCIGGANNPTLCVNGKFTESANLPVLSAYGISTGASGINTIQPLEIFATGEYTIELETSQSLSVEIDGVSIANLNVAIEPYARFKMTLEKGFHKIVVNGSASSTMALAISDSANNKFYHSRLWCNNSTTVECPVSGFVNYNNICERKTSAYCENGDYDETIGKCVLAPKCVLRGKESGTTFSDQDQSIRVEYFENASQRFICSPLTCLDNFCQLATCPEPSIGTDVELTAAEINDSLSELLCLDQECDANLAYFSLCGIEGSCDETREDVFVEGVYPNDICYEKYCDEGGYDPVSGKCKVLACPTNTEEDLAGNCIRK